MIGLGLQDENSEVNYIKRPNVFRCIGNYDAQYSYGLQKTA